MFIPINDLKQGKYTSRVPEFGLDSHVERFHYRLMWVKKHGENKLSGE